jgi:hypothetical protein
MFETFAFYALPFTFTLLVACLLTCVVCGVFLFLFRIRVTNQALRHPYLDKQSWERYPLSIRAAILLDYFLRISFPKSNFWIVGQANRLLSHVQPDELSTRLKWPLIGFWGGCLVGLVALLVLWTLILLTMA